MPFDLSDKVAAVTGAASGIGRSIAALFAARGARVYVLDLDTEGGGRASADIAAAGGVGRFLRCDVSSGADVSARFDELYREAGRLDILVNNAGVAHVGSLEATTESDLDRLYGVNVKGVYHCSRAALEKLRQRGGGVILNMASIAALVGLEQRFAYSMTKGAVLAMTLSIARDYLAEGVRCNCICPARVHTPFVDGFLARHFPGREQEMFQELSRAQPIGRMGRPDEIAALALYLCSDEAAFVTGACYPIDGGTTALI